VKLAERFVPAADEVWRLQSGQDLECRLFQEIAEQGHFAGRTQPSATRQGIYAAAPSGKLLASINSRDPKAVAGMLATALERWEALPRAERTRADLPAQPQWHSGRWETRYPADGLVLAVFVRDVEREAQPDDWRASAWNKDFAWFTREEALALVPETREVGAERAWPAELANRLARCNLVDCVRGQVPPFGREDVQLAELVTRVAAVSADGLELEITGRTRAVARGHWPIAGFADEGAAGEQERGFATELVGRALFEPASSRFMRFELVAVGTRWGGTQFNGRQDDLAEAPIGVSFTLAGSWPSERVPPFAIWDYGWPPH
jgi:hypothetical protein